MFLLGLKVNPEFCFFSSKEIFARQLDEVAELEFFPWNLPIQEGPTSKTGLYLKPTLQGNSVRQARMKKLRREFPSSLKDVEKES